MTSISRRSFSAGAALLPLLAAARQSPLALAQQSTPVLDIPVPIEFPRDDGVHDTSIEWWYFTGNVLTEVSERIGFEYVIFRAKPGNLEGFVSHFAVTSPGREVFVYDQRILGVQGVEGDAAALDLDLQGWTMRGENGNFTIQADMPKYAINFTSTTQKPAALHDGDGYIDYGNGTVLVLLHLDPAEGHRHHHHRRRRAARLRRGLDGSPVGRFRHLPGGRLGLVLDPARGQLRPDALRRARPGRGVPARRRHPGRSRRQRHLLRPGRLHDHADQLLDQPLHQHNISQ